MKAWLFDVDGVISNLKTKEANPQIVAEIVKRLQKKEPVALITGRSMKYLEDEVVPKIVAKIDKEILDTFFISGEFGGVSSSFENGQEAEKIDEDLSVPEALRNLVKDVTRDLETMFFDDTKKTMITTEMKDGYADMTRLKEEQESLSSKFEKLVEEFKIGINFEVVVDTIAVNIKNRNANKKNSALQVLNWLGNKNIKPEKFIAFGDSNTDLEMAQAVHDKGFDVEFVFVGNKEDIVGIGTPFKITKTRESYEKGTLEFLRNAVNSGS